MVDTIRSKTALAALFADNTAGDISAQDLRDLMESVHLQHGSMYISTSSATTISVAGTYAKAAGTTTSISLRGFTMPSNNRLTYTGSPNVHVQIVATASMTVGGNNKEVGLKVAKNGTVIDHSEVLRFVGTGADQGAAAIMGEAELATNDYIELFITNNTDTTSPTVTKMYMSVESMFE